MARLKKEQEEQCRVEIKKLERLVSANGFSWPAIRQTVSELQEFGESEVGALLRIAQGLMEVISWEEFCSIFKYALNVCTDEYVCAIYAVWLSLAEMFWLEIKEMPLKERKQIFKDTVKINQEFLDDDPENPARAYSRGILYYKYSPEQPDHKKAIYWFTLTKKWSIETEDDHLLNEAHTYLAHSYFHLEKWKLSLENFEKIDPEYLVTEDEEDYPEEFWARRVKQKMTICKEKLSI